MYNTAFVLSENGTIIGSNPNALPQRCDPAQLAGAQTRGAKRIVVLVSGRDLLSQPAAYMEITAYPVWVLDGVAYLAGMPPLGGGIDADALNAAQKQLVRNALRERSARAWTESPAEFRRALGAHR